MPQPWFCSSSLVLIHVGSDPSWDQTGQRLLGDFWLENRSRAQNRRKRMKGLRIRMRMITFVLAGVIPHAHTMLGSSFLAASHQVPMEQHPGCALEHSLHSQVSAWLWSQSQSLLLASWGSLSHLLFNLTLGRLRTWWQECPMHDLAPADGQDMPVLISGMCKPEGEKARNLMGTVE